MRAKREALTEALTGMFSDHHGELAQLLLDQIAFCDARIARLAILISEQLGQVTAAWGVDADGVTGPQAGAGSADAPVLPVLERLDEIPGVSAELAATIIAETGLDMSRFPTADHLVSWAGLCPRTSQSGPRTRHGKKHGDSYLRGCLGQAAIGAAGTPTFLGERFNRIARRRGKAKAQVAIARSILVIIWHLLADPAARFADLGPDYHQRRTDKDRKIRNHIRQLEALGYTVTITQAA
jgi:transposase